MNDKSDPVVKSDPLWVFPRSDSPWHQKIVDRFKIHPVTAQILVSRNFKTLDEIDHFLYAKLPDLHDPNLFEGMDKAVERVLVAIQKMEPILIYGDNDVDGMTSTALLTDFFRSIQAPVHYYIPNRNALKQSMIVNAMEYAEKHQCKLIITVDCGITAAAEIEEVKKKGIDVIVTDHHEPTDNLPHCIATLNPKLLGSSYPDRELTGVGVAFKLAHAITNERIRRGQLSSGHADLKRYLDLVALGTIADMGALIGENRILVRAGMLELQNCMRIGLEKLIHISNVELDTISPIDIASKIAPRLNSLGRIDEPRKGVDLLLCNNIDEAEKLAKELDLNNQERQKIDQENSELLANHMQSNQKIFNHRALVFSSDQLHPGIIPIISARIARDYNRPTALIALENGIGKGSIRTIHEFPILPILRECSHLLLNYGGHDYAAGLTIEEKNIPAFTEHFIKRADEMLTEQDIISKLKLDANVSFDMLSFEFMESLQLLEPFGNENPAPILYTKADQVWAPKVVSKVHLKLYLKQEDNALEGMGFRMADKRTKILAKPNEQTGKRSRKLPQIQIAFTPQINNYQGKSSIQLIMRDFNAVL